MRVKHIREKEREDGFLRGFSVSLEREKIFGGTQSHIPPQEILSFYYSAFKPFGPFFIKKIKKTITL